MPLSKHKSFPEGRIAPETLLGYATPALVTMQLDANSASLARTQVMGQPGGPYVAGAAYTHGARPAPNAVGTPTDSRRDSNGDWQPPKRGIPPLMLGVGLGLFVVTLLALGLTIWDGTNEPRKNEVSARAQLPAPTPAATVSPTLEAAQPAPTSTSPAVVSSVAAETFAPRQSSRDKAILPAQSSRKAGSIASPGPASKAPAPPAPGNAPSADLGF
jgi:hypothetical protein